MQIQLLCSKERRKMLSENGLHEKKFIGFKSILLRHVLSALRFSYLYHSDGFIPLGRDGKGKIVLLVLYSVFHNTPGSCHLDGDLQRPTGRNGNASPYVDGFFFFVVSQVCNEAALGETENHMKNMLVYL